MSRSCISIIILFFVNFNFAQIPTFQWAINMGSGSKGDHCIKVDASGNVYLTGFFQSTIDFDPGPGTFTLASEGLEDIFISKVDASGNLIWAKKIGGMGNDCGFSLSIDGSGNIYTAGYFSNTVDFDPGSGTYTLSAIGNKDIYVSKLDLNGNFLWAKKMGGPDDELCTSIALDNSGSIFATGSFSNTVDFDPGSATFTLSSNGMDDIFISKLDAAGNFLWAKQIGGTQSDQGLSIAVDALGNVSTAGYFHDVVDFDPGMAISTQTANGAKDVFYSKLDASGNFIYGLGFGSYTDDICYSIAVDPLGNLYSTGSYSGYCDFDPGPGSYMLNYIGSVSSIFISKLDASGNFVWAKSMNSWYVNEGRSIYADAVGNVFTMGIFGDAMDFDPGPGTYYMNPVPSYFGATDVFISKLNSSGVFLWARSFGGIWWDEGRSVFADPSGNVYIAGSYNFIADFDPGMNIVNLTPGGCYINKLGPCITTPSAPINTTLVNDQIICSGLTTTLSAWGAGTLYWYAASTTTTILNSGSVYITPVLSTGSYTYYVVAATCTPSPRTPITVTVNACVGINEASGVTYTTSLFPNPSNGSFIFEVENDIKKSELLIINSLGQSVYSQKVIKAKNNIDVSGLSKGLYNYIFFNDYQKSGIGKLVIE